MYLVWVDVEQLLLDACAETLETLRFDLSDPQSEAVSLKGVQGDNQQFLSRLLGPVAKQIAPGTRGCSLLVMDFVRYFLEHPQACTFDHHISRIL
jgi:hypothetical protein